MGKQRDEQKRAIWEQRLARHRASGATIAAFCREEGVSDRVFQYWARRLRAEKPSRARVTQSRAAARPQSAGERGPAPTIEVRLGEARFSIPADALDALRLVLSCLRDVPSGGQAFQHVVVAAR